MVDKIPYEGARVETGAIRFGDDWPGLFVRGDQALAIALAIDAIERLLPKDLNTALAFSPLAGVRDIIKGDVLIKEFPPHA